MIDELDREIADCERELRRLGADHHYVPLLLTVPGISWVLAYTIAAEIGDIHRFPTPRKLAGYTGLCPRVYQSGERDLRGPISKQGPRYLRWALVEAATHACTHPVYRERYQQTKAPLACCWAVERVEELDRVLASVADPSSGASAKQTAGVRGLRTVTPMVHSLEGLAPFQIAFVVRDLERAAREFDARLAAGPWRGWIFGPQGQGREYHGNPADWTLRLALNTRSPQYELIEPLDGPSIHADWLADRGEGFHHVGYIVESLEQTSAEMQAAGHPPIARIHSFGADGDGAAAYFDTAHALGFLIEAVEPPSRMPPMNFTL